MIDRQARLAASRLYLCTDARERQGDLPDFLDSALAGGVDIVQLRQKGLEARRELSYLEVFAQACERHGSLLAVNDRADLALAAGADILHLGQDDLPVAIARQIVGGEMLVGRSTHSPEQARAAASEVGTSYFCTGPCWPTPTKPGRAAPGLGLVSWAAEQGFTRPWFAIGGINLARLDEVIAAGAQGVVVVRAITDAADPGAAAAAIKSRVSRRTAGPLRHVPL